MLAWTQVHHGHLPLWNNYEALGMPLAFNWGSGAFSLPALVSYLTPLRVVYWVQILVSLVVGRDRGVLLRTGVTAASRSPAPSRGRRGF